MYCGFDVQISAELRLSAQTTGKNEHAENQSFPIQGSSLFLSKILSFIQPRNYCVHLYRSYPDYLDTLPFYRTCSRIWTTSFYNLFLCLHITGCVVNRTGPQNAASDLGLHCLLRPVCPNTYINTVFWLKAVYLNSVLKSINMAAV